MMALFWTGFLAYYAAEIVAGILRRVGVPV